MKSKNTEKAPRQYRQTARALASAATAQTIIESFLKRLNEQWFEEITLDAIAQDSNVTVQTVIRRFGNKEGLLKKAADHLGKSVDVRRPIRPGDIDFTVEALTDDYEAIGDLILRLLTQEDRQPVLKPLLDKGRRGHREWLATIFADNLKSLSQAKRRVRLDAMVVATDLYIWRLVRREMGRPVAAFKAISRQMLTAALKTE